MGWVRKVKPPHVCKPPSQTNAGIDSIWKCRKCKEKWTLYRKVAHPRNGIVLSHWAPIGKDK